MYIDIKQLNIKIFILFILFYRFIQSSELDKRRRNIDTQGTKYCSKLYYNRNSVKNFCGH